ncbi:hypothetical protein M3193_08030 [Sporosarcina luteola]|uniref:hypothetical protein n=1 Tax=Sporosarcina luteola TaxID=582850 RepID=UPI00203C6490|nr:hypothetical protein [Sporosarcina luteola]MCM3744090.1 hypothetical protein [Sporosarcina luteola]
MLNQQELFRSINKCIDDFDFVSARRYMEENMELLKENKHHLRRNARELFNFLVNNTADPITRQEMNIIYSINNYASNFNIRGLKIMVKNNIDLVLREKTMPYLNEDAKTILESMQVINR